MHALRPERVGRERRDERRVDPAREPEHDLAEAVLADVVPQGEHERPAHLLELGLERDDLAAEYFVLNNTFSQLEHGRLLLVLPVARERAAADVAQPPADRLARVDVHDEQCLLEAGGAGEHLAVVLEHDRVAVEEELVLTADEVAECEGGRLSRARSASIASRDSALPTWNGEAERLTSSSAPASARSARRARLPDVFADGRPD